MLARQRAIFPDTTENKLCGGASTKSVYETNPIFSAVCYPIKCQPHLAMRRSVRSKVSTRQIL